MEQLLINLLSFLSGTVFGWIVSKIYCTKGIKFNGKNILLMAVAIAWLISIVAEVINPSIYSTPVAVHAIMGAVVGSLFKGNNPLWSKK